MKRMIAAVLVATACASSNSAQAQDTKASAPPLTLDEALTAAGAVSPAVEVSRSGIQAAQAQRSIAGLRPRWRGQIGRAWTAGLLKKEHGASPSD